MPSYKVFTPQKKSQPSSNPAIRVTGYEENRGRGQVFVKGISLETGEELIAGLSDTDNKKRPSLAQLRDGYKVKGNVKKLEPGGILVLDKAIRQEGQNIFMARWPSVMAYNNEEAQQGKVATAMFTLNVGQTPNGRRYGYAIKHAPDVRHFINGKTAEDLRGGIESFASKVARPTFTVRAFKDNGKEQPKEVIAICKMESHFWNRDEKRKKTPQEIANGVVETVQKMQEVYPNTTLSVVPGMRYQISTFILDDDRKFELLQKVARCFRDKKDESMQVAKKCCVKLSQDDHSFINDIKVIQPYSPGIAPAYMAGLVPAQDEAPKNEPDEPLVQAASPAEAVTRSNVPEKEPETARKASSQEPAASDDPFMGVEEDDGPQP